MIQPPLHFWALQCKTHKKQHNMFNTFIFPLTGNTLIKQSSCAGWRWIIVLCKIWILTLNCGVVSWCRCPVNKVLSKKISSSSTQSIARYTSLPSLLAMQTGNRLKMRSHFNVAVLVCFIVQWIGTDFVQWRQSNHTEPELRHSVARRLLTDDGFHLLSWLLPSAVSPSQTFAVNEPAPLAHSSQESVCAGRGRVWRVCRAEWLRFIPVTPLAARERRLSMRLNGAVMAVGDHWSSAVCPFDWQTKQQKSDETYFHTAWLVFPPV